MRTWLITGVAAHPDTFHAELLDVIDTAAAHAACTDFPPGG